jgi:hypothetical protein
MIYLYADIGFVVAVLVVLRFIRGNKFTDSHATYKRTEIVVLVLSVLVLNLLTLIKYPMAYLWEYRNWYFKRIFISKTLLKPVVYFGSFIYGCVFDFNNEFNSGFFARCDKVGSIPFDLVLML